MSIDTGILQRTILGPLLFLMYMNESLTNCGSLISCSNDTTLVYTNNNLNMIEQRKKPRSHPNIKLADRK